MMIPRFAVLAALVLPISGPMLAVEEPAQKKVTYYVVDNFTGPLPSGPGIRSARVTADAKVGLAMARLEYNFGKAQTLRLSLPDESRPVSRGGTLRMWIKGDGSGHRLQLQLKHAQVVRATRDRARSLNRPNTLPALPEVVLDFEGWKEVSISADAVPRGGACWVSTILLHKNKAKDAKAAGTIFLDDMRLYPSSGAAPTSVSLKLVGPDIRSYDPVFEFLVDVRHFGEEDAVLESQVTILDHHENVVAERRDDLVIKLSPGGAREARIRVEPENFHLFLPPFRVKASMIPAGLTQIAGADIERTIVMGNSRLLFDDFSDVHGRWFTAGAGVRMDWNDGTIFGEVQRATANPQTNTRISRVTVPPAQDPKAPHPPGRYAMRIDWTGAGQAAVFTGRHRFLQGNAYDSSAKTGDAYRMGVWVRGDGSGAELMASVCDFSAPGSTFYTWKRRQTILHFGKLDFVGWRYIDRPLPGNGIGPRSLRGSTDGIDFPLELAAFAVQPARGRGEPAKGSVQIGPIFLDIQQYRAHALSVQVGYDDENHEYAPNRDAWVTVQNGWRATGRRMKASWSLLDREDRRIDGGQEIFRLEPQGSHTFSIKLSRSAEKIAPRTGPLRLRVVADDTGAAASAEAEILLAKPDSAALIADFEADRGYLGLRGNGVTNPPPPGEPAAKTVTTQKHSGERSLAMPWRKGARLFVSIDPPAPGQPSSITLWVHGDGSGVLFYPVLGDKFGVISGVEECLWDLFLPRTIDGKLHNAVEVDWKGWRKLTFRLPVIPRTWNDRKNLSFVPTYPLGIHLAVVPTAGTKGASGTIYVDDVSVGTHLVPADRLQMRLERGGESNLMPAGGALRVTVSNFEAPGAGRKTRKAVVTGGLYDWTGRRVVGTDTPVDLAPGSSRTIPVAPNVPSGAYHLRVRLKAGDEVLQSVAEDLVVADPKALLGAEWSTDVRDPVKLRLPLRDRFAFIRHDWDWTEFQPGNLQVETALQLAESVRKLQRDPWMLLGYSAYWAASSGHEDMVTDRLAPRDDRGKGGRDWGHDVDIFHVPRRMDDWENYVMEMMRLAGGDLAGFLLWNTPDARTPPLRVPPEKFVRMIQLTDKWRRRYCPKTPVLLGGLGRSTAISYIRKLIQADAEAQVAAAERAAAGDKPAPVAKPKPKSEPKTEAAKAAAAAEAAKAKALAVAKEMAHRQAVSEAAAKAKILNDFSGVNLRIDAGSISPEDGQLPEFIRKLQRVLTQGADKKKMILLTDLDWAVEREGPGGLDAFDQTVYLARATLLLDQLGVEPTLMLHNEDFQRLGVGLTYKKVLTIPPMIQKLPAFQFKPSWLGMVRVKKFLLEAAAVAEVAVQDIVPGRTRCLLYRRKKDKVLVAVIWRNNDLGDVSFAKAGLTPESAVDIFGTATAAQKGWYRIGKVPAMFTLKGGAEKEAIRALELLRVREAGKEPAWSQSVLASFTPADGKAYQYAQSGGKPKVFAGLTTGGFEGSWPGVEFAAGGSERFQVDVPAGAGLVLRKRFHLVKGQPRKEPSAKAGKTTTQQVAAERIALAMEPAEDRAGQVGEVLVNGKPVGVWDLKRVEQGLSLPGGLREAVFVIGAKALGGAKRATIEVGYKGYANSAGWVAYALRGGEFPLSSLGAYHADSKVTFPRLARNVVGLSLRIGQRDFTNGVGVFAPCLMEYSINGQFKKFKATLGVDGATEGRGSVIFEIRGDGKTLLKSEVITGLDKGKEVDVDVAGVKRLRLIVDDGGDGHKLDAANWADAVLIR